jgi:cellulose biosynthesis protein BcsQ
MHTISFYSMKGGVGKTAASVNIAYLAAAAGYRTLLVDLDPVGASSFFLKVRPKGNADGSVLVKGKKSLRSFCRHTDFPNLDMLPATFAYRNLDLLLDGKKHPRTRIGNNLSSLETSYDLLVFDGTPNLTLLSENILRASDCIFVPVIPSPLSLLALDLLFEHAGKLSIDPGRIRIFLSMVDRRKSVHVSTARDLLDRSDALSSPIPVCSEIEKMGLYRAPVSFSKPRSRGAMAYEALWKEIAQVLDGSASKTAETQTKTEPMEAP